MTVHDTNYENTFRVVSNKMGTLDIARLLPNDPKSKLASFIQPGCQQGSHEGPADVTIEISNEDTFALRKLGGENEVAPERRVVNRSHI